MTLLTMTANESEPMAYAARVAKMGYTTANEFKPVLL
jgi:hypothetical protein